EPPRRVRVYTRARHYWLVTYTRRPAGEERLFWGSIDWEREEPILEELTGTAALREALAVVGVLETKKGGRRQKARHACPRNRVCPMIALPKAVVIQSRAGTHRRVPLRSTSPMFIDQRFRPLQLLLCASAILAVLVATAPVQAAHSHAT